MDARPDRPRQPARQPVEPLADDAALLAGDVAPEQRPRAARGPGTAEDDEHGREPRTSRPGEGEQPGEEPGRRIPEHEARDHLPDQGPRPGRARRGPLGAVEQPSRAADGQEQRQQPEPQRGQRQRQVADRDRGPVTEEPAGAGDAEGVAPADRRMRGGDPHDQGRQGEHQPRARRGERPGRRRLPPVEPGRRLEHLVVGARLGAGVGPERTDTVAERVEKGHDRTIVAAPRRWARRARRGSVR